MDETQGAGRNLAGASALSLIIGGLWAYAGYHRMKPESHLFDVGRAREAARRYNDTVSPQPGATP